MRTFGRAALMATMIALFALFVGAGVAGAAQGAGLPQDVLVAEWRLVSFQAAGQDMVDVSANKITLRFEEGSRVSGFGGCNGFGGRYQAGANQALIIGEVISTLRACEENDLTVWETRYFDALQMVSHYRVAGDRLVLVFGGGGTLTFSQAGGGPQPGPTPEIPVPGMPRTGEPGSAPWAIGIASLIVLMGLAIRSGAARPARR